jgi:hypothetical protein
MSDGGPGDRHGLYVADAKTVGPDLACTGP